MSKKYLKLVPFWYFSEKAKIEKKFTKKSFQLHMTISAL